MNKCTLQGYLILSLFALSCGKSGHRRIITKVNDTTIVSIKKNGRPIVDSLFDRTNKLLRVVEYFYGEQNLPNKMIYYGNESGDSLIYEYFVSGILKRKERHYGRNMPFEELLYSPSGLPLMYRFYDSLENRVYLRIYTDSGKTITANDSPFFSAYISPSKAIYSTRDSLRALFIAPTPPDCETRLYTLHSGKSFNNINQIDSTSMFKVNVYPLEKGNYFWDVYLVITEKQTKRVFKSNIKRINYSVE